MRAPPRGSRRRPLDELPVRAGRHRAPVAHDGDRVAGREQHRARRHQHRRPAGARRASARPPRAPRSRRRARSSARAARAPARAPRARAPARSAGAGRRTATARRRRAASRRRAGGPRGRPRRRRPPARAPPRRASPPAAAPTFASTVSASSAASCGLVISAARAAAGPSAASSTPPIGDRAAGGRDLAAEAVEQGAAARPGRPRRRRAAIRARRRGRARRAGRGAARGRRARRASPARRRPAAPSGSAGGAASAALSRSAEPRARATMAPTQASRLSGPTRNCVTPTAAMSWPIEMSPAAASRPPASATRASATPGHEQRARLVGRLRPGRAERRVQRGAARRAVAGDPGAGPADAVQHPVALDEVGRDAGRVRRRLLLLGRAPGERAREPVRRPQRERQPDEHEQPELHGGEEQHRRARQQRDRHPDAERERAHDPGGGVDVGRRDAEQLAGQAPALAAAARVEHAVDESQPQAVGRPLVGGDADARAVPVGGREEREEHHEQHAPEHERVAVGRLDRGVERRADGDRHERLERLVRAEQRRRAGGPPALLAQRGPQQRRAAHSARWTRAAGTTIGAPVSGHGITGRAGRRPTRRARRRRSRPARPRATISPSRIAIRCVA